MKRGRPDEGGKGTVGLFGLETIRVTRKLLLVQQYCCSPLLQYDQSLRCIEFDNVCFSLFLSTLPMLPVSSSSWPLILSILELLLHSSSCTVLLMLPCLSLLLSILSVLGVSQPSGFHQSQGRCGTRSPNGRTRNCNQRARSALCRIA